MTAKPTGWGQCKLGELCDLINGDRGKNYPSKDALVTSGVAFINAGHLTEQGTIDRTSMNFITEERFQILGSGKVQVGDVLYCLRGSLGKSAIVRELERGAIASSLVIVRVREGLLPEYTHRFLMSPEGKRLIRAFDNGTAQPNLAAGSVAQYEIPVPPLNEQRRIVKKLDAIFEQTRAAKARLERLPALLDKLKRSILAAAFRGDLTADWRAAHPDAEPASALLDRIRIERRSRWDAALRSRGKDPSALHYQEPTVVDVANLPSLPNGWAWASLGFISDIQGGITKGQKRRPDEHLQSVPYLRVANVQRGHLDLQEVLEIEATQREIHDLALQSGDMLLNEGGDRDKLGRGWVWESQLPLCIHQNHVFRARVYVAGIDPKLISTYGNAFGQPWFIDEGKQTTNLASISKSKLSWFPVPVSPADEQLVMAERLLAQLATIDKLAARVSVSVEHAIAFERAALAKAFRGELVEQDPNDEPASVLLERIRAARAQDEKTPARPRGRRGRARDNAAPTTTSEASPRGDTEAQREPTAPAAPPYAPG